MRNENHNIVMYDVLNRLAIGQCERLRRAIEENDRLNKRISDYLDSENDEGTQQREESRANMTEQDLKDHRERNDIPKTTNETGEL